MGTLTLWIDRKRNDRPVRLVGNPEGYQTHREANVAGRHLERIYGPLVVYYDGTFVGEVYHPPVRDRKKPAGAMEDLFNEDEATRP